MSHTANDTRGKQYQCYTEHLVDSSPHSWIHSLYKGNIMLACGRGTVIASHSQALLQQLTPKQGDLLCIIECELEPCTLLQNVVQLIILCQESKSF